MQTQNKIQVYSLCFFKIFKKILKKHYFCVILKKVKEEDMDDKQKKPNHSTKESFTEDVVSAFKKALDAKKEEEKNKGLGK